VRRADHLHIPIDQKSGNLNLLEPSGPVIGLYRDYFTFLLLYVCDTHSPNPFNFVNSLTYRPRCNINKDIEGVMKFHYSTPQDSLGRGSVRSKASALLDNGMQCLMAGTYCLLRRLTGLSAGVFENHDCCSEH
jgi:hypothetical protein